MSMAIAERDRTLVGVGWMLVTTFLFVCVTGIVRYLGSELPAGAPWDPFPEARNMAAAPVDAEAPETPRRVPVAATLEARAKPEQVHLIGKKTGRELADAYAAMDVFVFSSQSETQGMVLAEAMAAGAPVVALDGPGVRDVVERELNHPQPLAAIVAGVADQAERATLYVLAFTVLRADEQVTGAERIYLAQLAHLLALDPAAAQKLEKDAAARIAQMAQAEFHRVELLILRHRIDHAFDREQIGIVRDRPPVLDADAFVDIAQLELLVRQPVIRRDAHAARDQVGVPGSQYR